jgi:tetratricopeptide (TPR) repeat protein
MPSWLLSAWDFLKDPDNQKVIGWLCGGIAAVASAIFAVVKFRAERKKADEKKGGVTNVAVGQGAGSGRDTTFQGAVSFGPSPEQIEQIQKPLADQLAAQRAQIENLTKALLERNPAAGPGAQQAVGAAVGSIVEGAAEGDSRLQKALGLLRENKITEASQLLKAFAGDKEARAEQATEQAAKDRKEAAVVYRNLGAIAGLADPMRALEAYEKALALDPDDLESLHWTGYILVDYGDLNKAQKRFERVQELAKATNQAFYQYAALGSLGDIKQQRGDLGGALQSYRGTISVISRLARSDPSNARWQRDLSVIYEKIGGVQEAQGDLAGALKSYSDSLAIRERLARSDPSNAGWQRDLSVSYSKIGDVQQAEGNLAGALKSYSDSFAIIERLAKSDPGNAGWQRDLSASYSKIGDVQQAEGNLAGALKSYSDSFAIIERLAKSDPGNAGWQRDLSVSYDKIGGVQEAQGDLAGALKSYQDGLAIIEPLAKSDPSNADWQRGLAVSLGKLALVHKQSGDEAKALAFLQQGQAIMACLTQLSPDNATWKGDLAWFDGQIAELAER